MRPRLRAGSVLAAALLLAGCAAQAEGARDGAEDTTPAPASQELSGELTVYAAASLAAAFDEIATRFEVLHPSLEVLPLISDGSSTLATQLVEGAPADVFASADEANMQKVVDAGLASDPVVFATNTLVIVVPAGNPGGVKIIEDLAWPETEVVLCAPEVPCGAASLALLDAQRVQVEPVSLEQSVTAVLTKVAAGEADAGLVYATDLARAEDVQAVAAEGAERIVNRYPIAPLGDAPNPAAAQAFADFVAGEEGQAVLAEFGFGAP
ncbi:molybdate ABC transporter substrate-binding protein [Microbacterium hominis]|uniref:molybdate ABC transporter substrate-binding protein n=1 Tax=Microbacterium hominis TaxID=162426 RepID=UPI003F687B50